jgi:hypothetical protein
MLKWPTIIIGLLYNSTQRGKEGIMFSKFVKKQMDKSPEEALNDGRKAVNNGISGGLTKAFMGQEFVDKMNSAMDQGQAAIDMQKGQMLAMSGLEARPRSWASRIRAHLSTWTWSSS